MCLFGASSCRLWTAGLRVARALATDLVLEELVVVAGFVATSGARPAAWVVVVGTGAFTIGTRPAALVVGFATASAELEEAFGATASELDGVTFAGVEEVWTAFAELEGARLFGVPAAAPAEVVVTNTACSRATA